MPCRDCRSTVASRTHTAHKRASRLRSETTQHDSLVSLCECGWLSCELCECGWLQWNDNRGKACISRRKILPPLHVYSRVISNGFTSPVSVSPLGSIHRHIRAARLHMAAARAMPPARTRRTFLTASIWQAPTWQSSGSGPRPVHRPSVASVAQHTPD